MERPVPIGVRERIVSIDVIRGFALFGVLWMNLFEHRGLMMPYDAVANLPTKAIDAWIGPLSAWLMQGKAQALFSILFGFGFANIMARLEARGLPAGRIFLRRIAVLGVFGLVNVLLLWLGDILHAYALVGFVLYFTRHWKTRTLILVGVPVAVLGGPVLALLRELSWGGTDPWSALWDKGAAIRGELLLGHDYPAFVAENIRASWGEWWTKPIFLSFLAQIFGRFLIGAWIYRQHVFDNPALHRALFAKVASIALPAGLLVAGLAAADDWFKLGLGPVQRVASQAGQLTLAVGYGAVLVLLHTDGKFARLFAGLAAVGRMALTNYLAQSFFYIFALYGFGLSLLPWMGATNALLLALAFFPLQVAFSLWWLARYRFGPLEWLWRSLTYGERQPMRLAVPAAAVA